MILLILLPNHLQSLFDNYDKEEGFESEHVFIENNKKY